MKISIKWNVIVPFHFPVDNVFRNILCSKTSKIFNNSQSKSHPCLLHYFNKNALAIYYLIINLVEKDFVSMGHHICICSKLHVLMYS